MRRPNASPLLALLIAIPPALAQPWGAKPYGILLLGHGGSSEWNRAVYDVQKIVADKKIPIEVALGMADPVSIQRAIDRLQQKHVEKIVAVPLFISSHSEVIDQTKY